MTEAFGPQVLSIDAPAEIDRIASFVSSSVAGMRRRGAVVAVSGGIDSSVCAALAVRALGAARVHALLLPERESSAPSTERGLALVRHLGVSHEVIDLTAALDAVGCYRDRDDAIREVVPEYGDGWRSKIVIEGGLSGGLNYFRLIAETPEGARRSERLPLQPYLAIVAATNHKQRLRKSMEYHAADRRHYAVVGTPNKLEHDLGFFVKNGDGSADLKPIAHLYKTQVYALAGALGLPESLRAAKPTTDTYTLPQGQDEFYFALPYDRMDLALWARLNEVPPHAAAPALGIDTRQVERVYADIDAKRRVAEHLGAPPRRIGH